MYRVIRGIMGDHDEEEQVTWRGSLSHYLYLPVDG